MDSTEKLRADLMTLLAGAGNCGYRFRLDGDVLEGIRPDGSIHIRICRPLDDDEMWKAMLETARDAGILDERAPRMPPPTTEEMGPFTVDNVRRAALEMARAEFESRGEMRCPAITLFVRRDPGSKEALAEPALLSLVPEEWDTDASDRLADIAKDTARELDAFAMTFVSESWIATATEEQRMGRRASEMPGRREAVVATIEHMALTDAEIWSAEISRDDGGATLGEFKKIGVPGTCGRFGHLLRPPTDA